jgi:hypothetical protein
MIALAIVGGFIAAGLFSVLMWRWMQVAERISVARAQAGGDERAKAITALTERVEKIERYMSGED